MELRFGRSRWNRSESFWEFLQRVSACFVGIGKSASWRLHPATQDSYNSTPPSWGTIGAPWAQNEIRDFEMDFRCGTLVDAQGLHGVEPGGAGCGEPDGYKRYGREDDGYAHEDGG